MTDEASEKKPYYIDRDQLLAVGAGLAVTLVSIFILGVVAGVRLEEGMKSDYAAARAKATQKVLSQAVEPATHVETRQGSQLETTVSQPVPQPLTAKPSKGERETPQKIAGAGKTNAPAAAENAGNDEAPAAAKAMDEIGPVPQAPAEQEPSEVLAKDSSRRFWTVQIKSSPDRKFAENWANRLKAKGYDAFIAQGEVGGRTWYRVRVGRFSAREEAEALQRSLESAEGFRGSLLTRHEESGDAMQAK